MENINEIKKDYCRKIIRSMRKESGRYWQKKAFLL